MKPGSLLPRIGTAPSLEHIMPSLAAIALSVIVVTTACAPPARIVPVSVTPSATDPVLDSLVTRAFAMDLAPGMAVAVVRGDRTVYLRGFGDADRDLARRVTPETIFYIASTTKAFTGLAAAILHQRGKLDLDAPLSRYLPDVRLHAPLSADSITLRALLSHTHGISNDGPIVWRTAFTGEFAGNEQLATLLAVHPPARGGRAYEYGNIGYNVAALAMDRVLGKSWRDLLDEEIFRPLGMTTTSAYVSGVPAGLLAQPYVFNGASFERVAYLKTDANMQAAGGLVSSARDMARWLQLQLNAGLLDGRQVIPAAAIAESQRIQAQTSRDQRGLRQIGYALGWQVLLRGNDTLLVHGGGFTGFATHVSFSLRRQVGVVVMANENSLGGALVDIVARNVYAHLLGAAEGADIPPDMDAQITRARQGIAADRARRAGRSQVLPYPLAAYAGTYENPSYGTITLRVVGDKLEAEAGAARSKVEVYDATKNQLRVELSGSGSVMPVEMRDGRAETLTVSGQTFTRR